MPYAGGDAAPDFRRRRALPAGIVLLPLSRPRHDGTLMFMELHWSKSEPPVEISSGDVHVWSVRLDESAGPTKAHWAVLSPDERLCAAEFRLDDPRRRFVIARAALRRLLGGYLRASAAGIILEIDSTGKPRLGGAHDDRDLHFNLAHSGDLALIAVTDGNAVGIDVERIRDVGHAEQIARRYFHPAETQAILAAPSAERDATFMRCWTGKEAVLKAIGSGITGSLAQFRVPTNNYRPTWIELPAPHYAHSRCWLQQLEPHSEYIAAVACLGAERLLRCFAFAI